MNYAGFWIRFWASLIDSLCLIPFLIVWYLVIVIQTSWVAGATGVEALIVVAALVGQWLYFALFESSKWQATPGKKVLNLRVVDPEGERISFGRATARYFSKAFLSWILLAGYIMAGLHDKKKALHDVIAGTFVLRGSLDSGPMTRLNSASGFPSNNDNVLHDPNNSNYVFAGFDQSGNVIRLSFSVYDSKLIGKGLVIGRDPSSADLVFSDTSVSRRHALVTSRDGALYLEDLSSTNGTTLQGTTLKASVRMKLAVGDEVTFGAAEFKLAKY